MVAVMQVMVPTLAVVATEIVAADAVVVMARMQATLVTLAILRRTATPRPVALMPIAAAVVVGAGRVQVLHPVPRVARRARHRCQTSSNALGAPSRTHFSISHLEH